MKEQALVGIIVLILIVPINAKETNDDSDVKLYLPNEFVIRRYLLNKYLFFGHREARTFTETERIFQNQSLKTHNILRAHHCVPPLVLDDSISAKAVAYAIHLASSDSPLIHSTDRGYLLGENLYALTRTQPITYADGDKATRAWYSEHTRYDYNKPGYAPNIGHFSQLVWKSSQRLGIGYAYARQHHKLYVVAMYGPPGNYAHAFRENVLEPKC